MRSEGTNLSRNFIQRRRHRGSVFTTMERASLLTILLSLLAWNAVEGITVHSRGETPVLSTTTTTTTTPSPISNQNFTLAVRLLEQMLLSQQRQRRLIIPYYGYYFVNNRNQISSYTPVTPFPVQNTPLDLLSRSIFSPVQAYSTQFHRNQVRPTYVPAISPSYADLFQSLARPKIVQQNYPTKQAADSLSFLNLDKSRFNPDFNPDKNHQYLVPPKPIDFPYTPEVPLSLPKLLSPLASVTRFSEPPPAKKAGKQGAPGRPGVDYPTFHKIPPTIFSCATQRYKGFFADPETSCQVWHYCDLNGGQASFLCPNGTIFSQVLLTCDWWFNVKCTNTLQAYVLNERLYKFIMPKKPSFPEDYSGLQVNDYLIQKQPEYQEKEVAKAERLKKKYKAFEFDDVDELQALLEKMRNGGKSQDDSEEDDKVLQDQV